MANAISHSNSSPNDSTLKPTAPIFTSTNANSLTVGDGKNRWPHCHDKYFCPVCGTEEDVEPASAAAKVTSEKVDADFNRDPGHEREVAFKAMAMAAEELGKNRRGNWPAVKRRIDAWLMGVEECEKEQEIRAYTHGGINDPGSAKAS